MDNNSEDDLEQEQNRGSWLTLCPIIINYYQLCAGVNVVALGYYLVAGL